jgi:hypothetical protein
MLDPPNRERLIRVLRLLSSDRLGERAAAGAMAHRIIATADLDWADVIRHAVQPYTPPPPDPPDEARDREAARAMFRGRDWTIGLSDAELDVILIYANTAEPTDRQREVMARIMAKIRANAYGR